MRGNRESRGEKDMRGEKINSDPLEGGRGHHGGVMRACVRVDAEEGGGRRRLGEVEV